MQYVMVGSARINQSQSKTKNCLPHVIIKYFLYYPGPKQAKRKTHDASELKANSKSLTLDEDLIRVEPGTTGWFYGVTNPRFKDHTRPLRPTRCVRSFFNISLAKPPSPQAQCVALMHESSGILGLRPRSMPSHFVS